MRGIAELLAGYRPLPDTAETTGTPFGHDARGRLAQLLMPGPERTGMSLGSLPPDHPLAAREHAAADEAWARTPGSPWQRPEALIKALDWYADATSTPKGAATDFVLSNFLGPAMGRIPRPTLSPEGMGGGRGARPKVETIDPKTLYLPEGMPSPAEVASRLPPDGKLPPIVAVRNADGRLEVLDGYHRTSRAISRGETVDAVVIPHETASKMVQEGLSQDDIVRVVMNEGMGGGKGIRAYHGSPHDFDRFDMSKIGTGEGGQSYGHGLYFAESEAVAKHYRDMLGPNNGRNNEEIKALTYLAKNKGNYSSAINEMERNRVALQYGASGIQPMPDAAASMKGGLELLRLWQSGEKQRPSLGRMYEVNIKADPDAFLDWDKPLSEQSEKAKQAFTKAFTEMSDEKGRQYIEESRRVLNQHANSPMGEAFDYFFKDGDKGTTTLRELGVPGIRYKDAGSRGADGGTSNYVVFDDALIDIVRKYGLAGLLSGGAAAAGVPAAQSEGQP